MNKTNNESFEQGMLVVLTVCFFIALAIVTCSSFSGCGGVSTQETQVWRHWTAPGDDGYVGRASYYEMRWDNKPIDDNTWWTANVVSGLPAPSIAGATDSVLVTVPLGQTIYFRIRACDEVPNCGALSNEYELDGVPPGEIRDLR